MFGASVDSSASESEPSRRSELPQPGMGDASSGLASVAAGNGVVVGVGDGEGESGEGAAVVGDGEAEGESPAISALQLSTGFGVVDAVGAEVGATTRTAGSLGVA